MAGISENRRIALNIIATYGRSLYGLILGIICGRWTYLTLGQQDYGLIGVVGGLAAFVGFFNSILSAGVGRFYALSVGYERKDAKLGLEKCREWFTTAVLIYSILPCIMIIVGYPAGAWAVRHFLTIPPERVNACIWVWRFTCFSCFVSMVTVPFSAMYTAKQEIAELTIYSFVTTSANAFFLYYAYHHPGDWLSRLSGWSCILSVIPSFIIAYRSFLKYQECRFRRIYLHCWNRFVEMLRYCSWITLGVLAWMARDQGVNLIVNKYRGPKVNAAMSIGNTISGHCTSLSGSMVGAFSPAIMNAYGAGDFERVQALAIRVSKLAVLFILIFALPLSIEINAVLRLWLKTPPLYASGLCVCLLAKILVDRSTQGHEIAIAAKGRLAAYQILSSGTMMMIFPVGWLLIHHNLHVYTIGIAMISLSCFAAIVRVALADLLLGIDWRRYFLGIALPLLVISAFSSLPGILMSLCVPPSFLRICLTTLAVEMPLLGLSWLFFLDSDEKNYLLSRLKKIMGRG